MYVAVACVIIAAGAWVFSTRNKRQSVKASRKGPSNSPRESSRSSSSVSDSNNNPTAAPINKAEASEPVDNEVTLPKPSAPAEPRAQKPLNLNSNEALEKHKEEFRRQKAARVEGKESAPQAAAYTEAPAEEEAQSGLAALAKAEASLASLSSKIESDFTAAATGESKKQSLSACKQQANQILNSLDEIATGDIEDDTLRDAAKARKKALATGVNSLVTRLSQL